MPRLICKNAHPIEQTLQKIENILNEENCELDMQNGNLVIINNKDEITWHISDIESGDYSTLPRELDTEKIWRYHG